MGSIFERLAQGVTGMQPSDHQDWNQVTNSVPPPRFAQASEQALQQVSSQDYYDHTQPGVGGTNPFGDMQPAQRTGIAETLLGMLSGRGITQQQVGQQTGLGPVDPRNMSPEQLAALAQWMHQNHPDVLAQAATQYQSQPDVISRLMGNKALLALGAVLGASILSNRSRNH